MSTVCKQFNSWVATQKFSLFYFCRKSSGKISLGSLLCRILSAISIHNSVEQKFVVNTPSCATKVSDHSCIVAFVSSVLRLDFLLESELFLRLSCALVPTFKTTFCAISSDSRSVSSFPSALVEFNKQTDEVVGVEHLCGMVNRHSGDLLIFRCKLKKSQNVNCLSEIYHWKKWEVRSMPLYRFGPTAEKLGVMSIGEKDIRNRNNWFNFSYYGI